MCSSGVSKNRPVESLSGFCMYQNLFNLNFFAIALFKSMFKLKKTLNIYNGKTLR